MFPTLFYLLVREHDPSLRRAAAATGLLLGALVSAMLVAAGDHTVAEAAAGWLTGATVSVAAITVIRPMAFPGSLQGLACALGAFVGMAWVMKWAPLGYWMARAALALSGNDRLHSWDSCG